jgi:predicted DNA-binding transcriptional regulator AlpA
MSVFWLLVDVTLHPESPVFQCQTPGVGRRVNVDDLIDAREVARLIGLARETSVSVYQRRYPDMPRPVVRRSSGRCLLWLRQDVEAWAKAVRRQ